MSEEQEPFTGPDEGETIDAKLEPGTPITREQVAEAMRRSTGALATAVFENVNEADLPQFEMMTGIASGALAWAANAYYRYWKAAGMADGKIRAMMNRELDGFWKQSQANFARKQN
jgi:hypothetical protein